MEQAAANFSSLGKYRLIASLDQGGMANLYVALMAGLAGFQKLLVLKVLRQDLLAGSDEGIQLFLNEARLAARLDHPNIVQTYEVGEIEGRWFLAMEYLEGQSYRATQTRAAPRGLPLVQELRILAEVARGLHYVHELKSLSGQPLGVVHRDVSPQNVFLTYDGQVKLLDFGIAKALDAGNLTQVGVIKGKIDYIAPEQLRGDPVDRRADIFAMGAMLWEAVTGQRFAGGRTVSTVTKVHARITGCEGQVRTIVPDVPEELARIIDRAIAVDPEDRWPTAAAFGEALEAYIESTGDKPSAKSLAVIMSSLFEADQRRMRDVIERQIALDNQRRALGLTDATGELPQLGARDVRTGSGLWLTGLDHQPGDTTGLSQNIRGALATTSYKAQPVGTRRYLHPLTVVLASATLGAGVALLALRDTPKTVELAASTQQHAPGATSSAPQAPTSEPARAPAPTTAPAQVQAPRSIHLALRVTPEHAHVTIDGAPVASFFTGEFRQDTALHLVEASARGYRPTKQLIAFDRDHVLDIALKRASTNIRDASAVELVSPLVKAEQGAATAAAEPRAPKDESAPIVPGADLTNLRPQLQHNIDTDDPYAGKRH